MNQFQFIKVSNLIFIYCSPPNLFCSLDLNDLESELKAYTCKFGGVVRLKKLLLCLLLYITKIDLYFLIIDILGGQEHGRRKKEG